jgi:hypothetical protein
MFRAAEARSGALDLTRNGNIQWHLCPNPRVAESHIRRVQAFVQEPCGGRLLIFAASHSSQHLHHGGQLQKRADTPAAIAKPWLVLTNYWSVTGRDDTTICAPDGRSAPGRHRTGARSYRRGLIALAPRWSRWPAEGRHEREHREWSGGRNGSLRPNETALYVRVEKPQAHNLKVIDSNPIADHPAQPSRQRLSPKALRGARPTGRRRRDNGR